jgi:hypothetical protein
MATKRKFTLGSEPLLHKKTTNLIERLDEFGVLVRNVLLDEGSGLEEFLACLASILAFVFLLHVRLDDLA